MKINRKVAALVAAPLLTVAAPSAAAVKITATAPSFAASLTLPSDTGGFSQTEATFQNVAGTINNAPFFFHYVSFVNGGRAVFSNNNGDGFGGWAFNQPPMNVGATLRPGTYHLEGSYTLGLQTTQANFDLTIEAAGVPEPTTWAMMLGGFGVLGAASRRRVRSTVTYV